MIMAIALVARNTSNFLSEGKHIVTIKAVAPALPQGEAAWSDKTPQLKVTFAKLSQMFSNWYNTLGYKKFSELTQKEQQSGKFEAVGEDGYAMLKSNKTRVIDAVFEVNGKRVEAPTRAKYDELMAAGHPLVGGRTLDALNIISKLAFDSGVSEGENFTEGDLIGRTVGITIGDNERSNSRVKGTFMPNAAALAEAEHAG